MVDVAVLTAAHGLCAGEELQEVSAELRPNPRQVRKSRRLSRTWTRTCYGSHAAVASASILGFSGGIFSAAARPGQRPHPYLAQTWHSKIEIRDENRK